MSITIKLVPTLRLFFCPRYEKGFPFDHKLHQGKSIDIFALPKVEPVATKVSNSFTDAAEDMGVRDCDSDHSLKRWAATHSNRFQIAMAVEELASEKVRNHKGRCSL